MVKGQKIREKGKVKFSKYFQKLEEGTQVAVVRDFGVNAAFPKRIQGKSGKIIGTRGTCKLVSIADGNKVKTYILHPIHLKKI